MDYRNLLEQFAEKKPSISLGYFLGFGMIAAAAVGVVRGPSRAAAEATNFGQLQHTNIVPPNALVGRCIAIDDAQGTGLQAYTILAPAGWHGKAAVLWDLARTSSPSDLFVSVTDPSSSENYTHLPSVPCVWSPQYAQFSAQVGAKVQGCLVLRPPTNAIQAIQQVLIPMYFGSIDGRYQVESTQSLPRLAASLSPQYSLASQGPSNVDAARIRIRYMENLQPVETELSCVMVFSQSPAGCVWELDHVSAFTGAPQALARDMDTLQMIALSLHETAPFMDAVDRVSQMLAGQTNVNQAALLRHVGSLEHAQQQISPDLLSRWQEQNRQQEQIFQNYDANAVRSVSERFNPFTNETDAVPSQYTHVWVNAAGDRIYADSEIFDPNANSTAQWRDEQTAN